MRRVLTMIALMAASSEASSLCDKGYEHCHWHVIGNHEFCLCYFHEKPHSSLPDIPIKVKKVVNNITHMHK